LLVPYFLLLFPTSFSIFLWGVWRMSLFFSLCIPPSFYRFCFSLLAGVLSLPLTLWHLCLRELFFLFQVNVVCSLHPQRIGYIYPRPRPVLRFTRSLFPSFSTSYFWGFDSIPSLISPTRGPFLLDVRIYAPQKGFFVITVGDFAQATRSPSYQRCLLCQVSFSGTAILTSSLPLFDDRDAIFLPILLSSSTTLSVFSFYLPLAIFLPPPQQRDPNKCRSLFWQCQRLFQQW